MDEFEQQPGEGLISYAIRRRNLPADHPARLTSEQCGQFVSAAIAAVERQQRRNIEALRRAGLSNSLA